MQIFPSPPDDTSTKTCTCVCGSVCLSACTFPRMFVFVSVYVCRWQMLVVLWAALWSGSRVLRWKTHTPSVPPPLQLLSQGMKICFTVILPERTTSFDSDFNGVHHFNAHWYSALLGSRLNSGLSCIFSTTFKKVSSVKRRNSIQNHRSTPRPVRCHCLFAFVLQTTINIGCQTRNGTLARAVQI